MAKICIQIKYNTLKHKNKQLYTFICLSKLAWKSDFNNLLYWKSFLYSKIISIHVIQVFENTKQNCPLLKVFWG